MRSPAEKCRGSFFCSRLFQFIVLISRYALPLFALATLTNSLVNRTQSTSRLDALVYSSASRRAYRVRLAAAMPAVEIFIALMGLASAASPAAALRPWAGCTRSSLLEVRMNGTG